MVIDAQRAPIQNAEVSITNVATREKLTTITGADGSFHGNALLAGIYTVLIAKTSFKQLLVENASVNVGADLGLGELQLNLGEASTTITVQSVSGLAEGTEPQLSRSFGTQALTSLPGILENNGLDNLALLVPGVAEGLYTRTGERSVLEYMREAQELGVRFYACSDALQVHDVDRNDLLSGITGFAGAAAFMARALDRDWVTLTY